MYDVDERDEVIELTEVPQSSVGAPIPDVVAEEGAVHLTYLAQVPAPGWDGNSVGIAQVDSDDLVIHVTFESPCAWFHGPPNDEAFAGHPLAHRGLRAYGVF